MLLKNKILVLLLLLGFIGGAGAYGSRSSVNAKLDSTILMMGKMTNLELTVEQDKGENGSFPFFSQFRQTGIVGVCGDSVELRAPVKADTTEKNGRVRIKYYIPVQSFDSGYYKLPEFSYVTGRDTTLSNSVTLKVVPVMVKENTPIDDYANVSDPEISSIFDLLPDWLLDYWWVFFLLELLLIAGIIIWIKYRTGGRLIGKRYIPTPYEIAISSLKDLKAKKLWEQGMEKEYFTDLTEILRIYMYGRFGINAMEMTSRQIINALKNNNETNDKRQYIRQILNMADFVKFAKVRPLPADNVASYDNAVKFVEETKPVPIEENPEESNQMDNPENGKKKKSEKGGKS